MPNDLIGQHLIATGHFELTQFSALDIVLADPLRTLGLDIDFSGGFLDVGANIGLYTLRYMHRFKSTLAVEANPATYHVLNANILLARAPNACAVCIGASESPGEAVLNVSSEGMLGWSRLGNDASWDTYPVSIRLQPLDEIAAPMRANTRIALLKIDVEGHELPVLKGATEILTRDGPLVLFEVLSAKAGADAAALLQSAGYDDFFIFARKLTAHWTGLYPSVRCIRVNPTKLSPSSLVFAAKRQARV